MTEKAEKQSKNFTAGPKDDMQLNIIIQNKHVFW